MEKAAEFENFIVYLNFLNEKLAKFFKQQEPYIFCKKGCGKCCCNAQFPYSEMEIKYLLLGFSQLPFDIQHTIKLNIDNIKHQKQEFKGDIFRYTCPFLINNICSVYNFRGIICRTFGLMTNDTDGSFKIPFCAYEGLNYSNVLDTKTDKISKEKYEQSKIVQEPLSYNVSYKFLTDKDTETAFKFKFGEKKQLIDWF